jgi:LacI family transcriptional regulator
MASGLQRRKKVTIAEIAAAVGVSKATVSFVLNDTFRAAAINAETKQRIFDAAQRMGYSPNAAARSLATGRSNAILVVLFDVKGIDLATYIRDVESHLAPIGYSIRICTTTLVATPPTYVDILRTRQADGVILVGKAHQKDAQAVANLVNEARDAGVPVVAMHDSFLPLTTIDILFIDSVHIAAQTLLDLINN